MRLDYYTGATTTLNRYFHSLFQELSGQAFAAVAHHHSARLMDSRNVSVHLKRGPVSFPGCWPSCALAIWRDTNAVGS